jgi:phosphoribosylformimino-5-aminoimidazole carboxamide ribotide isomerase
MQLIPVIDLMGGAVVHARRGERDRYQPVQSKLCPSAEPAAILEALLRLHPFPAVYFADLDAIRGRGDHFALLRGLRERYPGVEFWIDAGIGDGARLRQFSDRALETVILGSESMNDSSLLDAARSRGDFILSLDFKNEIFLGPSALERDAALWPGRVLAMNLARVGSALGPDLALIAALRARRADCGVFAAGGVRGRADLQALRDQGAAGALVATALHSGALSAADVAEFSR